MGARAVVGEGHQSRVLVDQRASGERDKTPAFRDAWKRGQRCLVITDGFYEWKKPEKQPYAIGMADDDLMVMAGLWDGWKSPKGEHVKSCTIITCPPNKVASALHDRMPVILAPDTWSTWLGEQVATPDEVKALLVPCPDEVLRIWPVDRTKIGVVRNKARDIADPISLSA
jgi:putative SOS response-associated peptidase YedK